MQVVLVGATGQIIPGLSISDQLNHEEWKL